MNDINYPRNSIMEQPEESNKERLKPVVTQDSIVSTKKPLLQRFKEGLFGDEVFDNVIIPAVGNMILDSLEMMFFHRTGYRNNYQQPPQNYTYNYGYGYNSQPYMPQPSYQYNQQPQQYVQNKVDYHNIILRSKQDADAVLNQMIDRIRSYGAVSIADLFDLIQVPGEYTDNNWGWRDARYFGVRRVAKGFLLVLPDAAPLGY